MSNALDLYLDAWDSGLFEDQDVIENALSQLDKALREINSVIDSPLPASLDELREKGIEISWKGIDRAALEVETAYLPALRQHDRKRLIRCGDVLRTLQDAEEGLMIDGIKSPMKIYLDGWRELWMTLKAVFTNRRRIGRLLKRAFIQIGGSWAYPLGTGKNNALFGVVAGVLTLATVLVTASNFTKTVNAALKLRSLDEIKMRSKILPQSNATRHVREKRSRA